MPFQAVAATGVEELICTGSGIGYGTGAVWVGLTRQGTAQRFSITTVNVPRVAPADATPVVSVCRTEDQRVAIDRDAARGLRYRAWSHSRSLVGWPDIELPSGVESVEGTGPCAHRLWSFTNGTTTYSVGMPGCGPATPPAGAMGELIAVVNGSTRRSWCY